MPRRKNKTKWKSLDKAERMLDVRDTRNIKKATLGGAAGGAAIGVLGGPMGAAVGAVFGAGLGSAIGGMLGSEGGPLARDIDRYLRKSATYKAESRMKWPANTAPRTVVRNERNDDYIRRTSPEGAEWMGFSKPPKRGRK